MYNTGDDLEYQAELSKSIYVMCGVCLVFIIGMYVERTKPAPILPVHVETKGTI